MIPTPDWHERCTLLAPGRPDRQGTLADLVVLASRLDPQDRPDFLLVSNALGELDAEQIEALGRRADFPGV